MTNTQRAAMQQALDALEISLPAKCADQPDRLYLQERDKHRTAIAALRKALAEVPLLTERELIDLFGGYGGLHTTQLMQFRIVEQAVRQKAGIR